MRQAPTELRVEGQAGIERLAEKILRCTGQGQPSRRLQIAASMAIILLISGRAELDIPGINFGSGGLGLLADAGDLLQVVASVDDVEATPLLGSEGSEDKVRGEGTLGKELPGLFESGVQVFEFRFHPCAEFVAGHGWHISLAGADRLGGSRAARKSAAANDQELQDVVFHLRGSGGGRIAGEVAIDQGSGTAIGEDQVLYDILRAPGGIFSAAGRGWMEPTGSAVFAMEIFLVEFVEIFEQGVHDFLHDFRVLRTQAQRPLCGGKARRRLL
jgi:hypothetical protein